jgi:hypothetical protein
MWSLHGKAIHVCLEFASNARGTVAITIGSRSSDDSEECGRVLRQLLYGPPMVGREIHLGAFKKYRMHHRVIIDTLTFRVIVIRQTVVRRFLGEVDDRSCCCGSLQFLAGAAVLVARPEIAETGSVSTKKAAFNSDKNGRSGSPRSGRDVGVGSLAPQRSQEESRRARLRLPGGCIAIITKRAQWRCAKSGERKSLLPAR